MQPKISQHVASLESRGRTIISAKLESNLFTKLNPCGGPGIHLGCLVRPGRRSAGGRGQMAADESEGPQKPGPPNYPLIYPKYRLLRTIIRALLTGPWGSWKGLRFRLRSRIEGFYRRKYYPYALGEYHLHTGT